MSVGQYILTFGMLISFIIMITLIVIDVRDKSYYNNSGRTFFGVLIFGLGTIFSLIIGGGFIHNQYICRVDAQNIHVDYKYGFFEGCRWEINGVWVDPNKYRFELSE